MDYYFTKYKVTNRLHNYINCQNLYLIKQVIMFLIQIFWMEELGSCLFINY
jgi:hypothetical protein